SRARTVHFLRTLAHAGTLDQTIKASVPTAIMLRNGAVSHRFVYNPGAGAVTVTFSDGRFVSVPAGQVIDFEAAPSTCDSIDFNNDGIFPDNVDVIDFLNVLAGGVCSGQNPVDAPCNTDVDFNNDSVFPDNADLEMFLNVLGGGGC